MTITNQPRTSQHTCHQALIDALKSMPLPVSHMRWNETISLVVTDHDEISFVWYIRAGQ
ncbi:MAG: hypothetical protein AB9891_01565 [Anaerolineaceae bacterium]